MAIKLDFEQLLLQLQLTSQEKLDLARKELLERGMSAEEIKNPFAGLAEQLLKKEFISKDQLIPILEHVSGVPYIDLKEYKIDSNAVGILGEALAKKYSCISVSINNNRLQIVMENPLLLVAIQDIELFTGYSTDIHWSFPDEVRRAVVNNYVSSAATEKALEEIEDLEEEEEPDHTAQDVEVERAPIVRLLNSLLLQAVQMGASDIHIEPMEKSVRVRFRIDGDMREITSLSRATQAPLVARIKIMSNLDIAEKRVPQDGRIEIKLDGRPVDLRVSLLPTVFGEKAVLRILERSSTMYTKQQLGFTEHNADQFERMLKIPEGIILVSGPTGSGKTTTLYASLNELNSPTVNIITVEDPVEYRIPGIHQVQVNTKAGLTFAAGLRSILRQDPDIIMVGEIRDAETAEIAARAAITGHIVLSTIHTNDTVSTIYRMIDMGVDDYMVASALVGVVAQRLVKRVCTNCADVHESTPDETKLLGLKEPAPVREAIGCNICGGTGYAGRVAVHEVLLIDKELRAMIMEKQPADIIKERACRKGMLTLQQSCAELVLEGITSVSEMLRVTYSV